MIGMNSIAAYCMAGLFEGFFWKSLNTHLRREAFQILGEALRAVAPPRCRLAGPVADPVLDVPP